MGTPLSRESLDAMIVEALAEADDDVRAAWEQIRVEPVRWRCTPWGDATGGFWVVAVNGREVTWYNEVEEGFNTTPFSESGTIDAYHCDQTGFSDYLRTLPEAVAAQNHAAARADRVVPASLRSGGTIIKRQTTYWTVLSSADQAWRVHFTGKAEARFAEKSCSTIQVLDAHPILENHNTTWARLYVASAAADADELTNALSGRLRVATGGWRNLMDYVTPNVLSLGYGSLMNGPERLVHVAAEVLDERAIRHSMIAGGQSVDACRLLLLGRSFVAAHAFRFEEQ